MSLMVANNATPVGKNGATESMAACFKENKTSVGAALFPNSVTARGSVTGLTAMICNYTCGSPLRVFLGVLLG
jgi:hypothetical protein